MLFCRIGYFPAKQYEKPLVLFSSSCAPFSGLLSLGCECAHYTTVSDCFPLIFLKRKGATIFKMLEKRESIVSVTSSCSEVLDMLRNWDTSGRLLTKQSFVVEVMVLPYL